MQTSSTSNDKMNRAVVAFLDGRRLKGYIFNFSALKDTFRLFPDEMAHQTSGTDVLLKDLKAVFFVKDFSGNPNYHESSEGSPAQHGRRVEVIFTDGEKLSGTTDAYHPQKLGFFVFPIDSHSNNARVFVVNKNVRQVKII